MSRYENKHREAMEQYLRRKLEPWEIVHHINGDCTDHRIENLLLTDRSEHMVIHREGIARSFKTCVSISEGVKKQWEDPDKRENLMKGLNDSWTEERKRNHSEIMKEWWAERKGL